MVKLKEVVNKCFALVRFLHCFRNCFAHYTYSHSAHFALCSAKNRQYPGLNLDSRIEEWTHVCLGFAGRNWLTNKI